MASRKVAPTLNEDARRLFTAMAVAGARCCAEWAHGEESGVFWSMTDLAALARAWVKAADAPKSKAKRRALARLSRAGRSGRTRP